MSNLDDLDEVLEHIDPSDVIWGADAIGAVINRTKRQAFYLLQNGEIPARKIGGQYVASRQALLRFVLLEAKAS